jgi:hypothetical protein
MKKLVIIVIAVIVAVVALLLIFGNRYQPSQTQTPTGGTGTLPSPSVSSSSIPSGDTVLLGTSQGTVAVKNFYKEAEIMNQNTVFLRMDSFNNAAHYDFGYNRLGSQFYIMIDAYSLADAIKYRSAAEEDLLNTLGISEADACKLNIDLRVNPTYIFAGNYPSNFAQMNYGLSFCPNGISF